MAIGDINYQDIMIMAAGLEYILIKKEIWNIEQDISGCQQDQVSL